MPGSAIKSWGSAAYLDPSPNLPLLGKLLNLPVPWFTHLHHGDKTHRNIMRTNGWTPSTAWYTVSAK